MKRKRVKKLAVHISHQSYTSSSKSKFCSETAVWSKRGTEKLPNLEFHFVYSEFLLRFFANE